MTIDAELQSGFNAAVAGINAVKALLGAGSTPLSTLNTTQADTIVNALNSLKSEVDAASSSGGAEINDGVTNATNVWSSNKIQSELSALSTAVITQLTDGSPAVADTMNELYNFIQSNDSSIITMLATQAKRVGVDVVQNFSAGEKVQGNANLGSVSLVQFGPIDTDYSALVTAGLV